MPVPLCDRPKNVNIQLEGPVAEYMRRVTDQWLLVAPQANPAMLEMLRDRDRHPARALLPWSGEFAGKYLTGATQVFRVTGDARLKAHLEEFVNDLLPLQAEDGYFGPWSIPFRLTNRGASVVEPENEGLTWDAWGHYHLMLGLLLWNETSGDDRALDAARRIGDLLCRMYLGEKNPILSRTGSEEMNLSPAHSLCLLYRRTGDDSYLKLARQIVEEFATQDSEGRFIAGDYLNGALSGKEFYQLPKPRWESLHPIMSMAELFYITGEPKLKEAYERIWRSIVKLERHNNGGFSSDEQGQGNPYHPGAIETCCTIAWIALSVEMLRLTGDSRVADELELSILNSVIGMHSASGRWATYDTPMDGVRKASAHSIVFQSREGSPELNCCSVNSARGFGMIGDWALMEDAEGFRLNWYGPGILSASSPNGAKFEIELSTDYPREGEASILIRPEKPVEMTLKLRIPGWSERTEASVNGQSVGAIQAGRYLALKRIWSPGDKIEIRFDFTPHYWVGEREREGQVSIYRGPILLAYDRRLNACDPDEIPELDARKLTLRRVDPGSRLPPILRLECEGIDGAPLHLCDFGSAGEGGSPYRSWLKVKGVHPAEFSEENPLRSSRKLDF